MLKLLFIERAYILCSKFIMNLSCVLMYSENILFYIVKNLQDCIVIVIFDTIHIGLYIKCALLWVLFYQFENVRQVEMTLTSSID